MSVRTWLSYLLHCRWRAVSAFTTCCKQHFTETHGHLGDSLPAASFAARSLPGSLNVEDLSVSISQLISPAPLATASAAHSSCRAVSTCSYHPAQDTPGQQEAGSASASASVSHTELRGCWDAAFNLHHHPDGCRTMVRCFKLMSG